MRGPRCGAPVLLLLAAGAACAPAIEAAVSPGYLNPAPAAMPGRFGASTEAERWLPLVGRLEPRWELGCGDGACRGRGLVRAIRQVAARGAQAAIVAAPDTELARQPAVGAAARAAGLLLLVGRDLTTDDGIALTLIEPADENPAAAAALAATAPSPTTTAWRTEVARAISAGGVAVLRRPCRQEAALARLLADPAVAELFSAVEVGGSALLDPPCDRQQWHGWLRRGQRWFALGVDSDLLGAGAAQPSNLAAVDERTPTALLRAIASGRTQLIADPRQRPRLEFGLTTDADGQLEERLAAQPVVVAGESVVVHWRVVGGRGAELLLYTELADGPVERVVVDRSDAVAAFLYPVPAGRGGFVRAELYRGSDVVAISQPVYFMRAPAPGTPERSTP